MIDRIAPTRRPAGKPALLQRWQQLLFLHWPVPTESLRPLLPSRLTVDAFEGRTFVGLVPFTMSGIRPPFAPALPWLSAFHETNVRVYVHLDGAEPGVYFFSLEAANPLAVWIARTFWKLNYQRARMSLRAVNGRVDYRSERVGPGPLPAECEASCEVLGAPAPATPGTLEHFLAERYVLYTSAPGRLLRGRVHHLPYPLQPARLLSLRENLVAQAGLPPPSGAPHVLYSAGVEVEVFGLEAC